MKDKYEKLWGVERRHEGETWTVYEVCPEKKQELMDLLKSNGFGVSEAFLHGKVTLRFPTHIDGQFMDVTEGHCILLQNTNKQDVCMSVCFDKQLLLPVDGQDILIGGA